MDLICSLCVSPGECGSGGAHVLSVLPAHGRKNDTDSHQVQEPQSHGHYWFLR